MTPPRASTSAKPAKWHALPSLPWPPPTKPSATAAFALEEIDHTRFGVILSSGIGGLPTIEEEHTRGQQRGFEKVSPYFVPMSIGNMAAGQIAIRFGLQGMCSCPTTACAGGTNAIGDAFHRIRDGYEDRMLCGGSESCISPLGVGGFASMKALCTADDPARASIPLIPAAAAL